MKDFLEQACSRNLQESVKSESVNKKQKRTLTYFYPYPYPNDFHTFQHMLSSLEDKIARNKLFMLVGTAPSSCQTVVHAKACPSHRCKAEGLRDFHLDLTLFLTVFYWGVL